MFLDYFALGVLVFVTIVILFWATLYREDRGWGFQTGSSPADQIAGLKAELEAGSMRLQALEKTKVLLRMAGWMNYVFPLH